MRADWTEEQLREVDPHIDFKMLLDMWRDTNLDSLDSFAINLPGAKAMGIDISTAPEGSYCLVTKDGITFPVEGE